MKNSFFRAPTAKGEIFVIFRRFRLNLGVLHASAKRFNVFYRGTATRTAMLQHMTMMTLSFSNFRGGGIRPTPC